ncbi:hypothetical protein [Flavobacterium sp. NKUCC04_CG]|uniref:hypothetical protein n=1 Tax=Flavobacterium sp. NKUCC04_CG TaxID=2842121 RepID=UPI001C5BD57B|nr:hypothetical protein [Flavobacterium sp. NKUCC04_CG]MBW3520481.1 hypothetical protein [Flavobacterium sp. NKUCC04_CG]
MIRICYALVLSFFMCYFSGCNSYYKINAKKEVGNALKYLVVVTVSSKANGDIMMMNGVGSKKKLSMLSKKSIDDFFKTFYNNYAYSPLMIDLENGYKEFVNCFGYDMSWYNEYYINDLTKDPESISEIELGDGFYVSMEFYRLLDGIEIKYVQIDLGHCLYDISLEIDYKKKISIVKKVALFLDKNQDATPLLVHEE